jgi:NodT family efflux transporter outer membrane factor (OMF) lipoprotein
MRAPLVNSVGLESDAIKAETPLAEDFPITLATASVSVSYTLDLFGKNRRELEALRAAVEYERFELEAARLMLAGNVVTAAIEEASLREQIEATEAAVALEGRQLEIVERLEQLGGVPKVDVVSQSGELARTRAALPALRRGLEQTRHRLAVYLGQPPAAAQLPEFHLADLRLPTELPLSLPSDLARQRPDIRAAEALFHEASARVGVATANFYPRITLSGTAGAVAVTPLLNGVAGFALLGASLTQPLFHGGELKARKRSALAALDQAGAAYREAVLSGLQDVADTLVALDADARTLRERAEAAASAKTAYDIPRGSTRAAASACSRLLDAQRQQLAASIEETRAIGDRFADSAALFQALGGGWWTAETAQGRSGAALIDASCR